MKKMTKQIHIGNVKVGGGAPCSVQSMCNTDTRDVASTLVQIRDLASAGCELVRCAVLDMTAAEALGEIKKQSPIPVIADIHFDYKLAMKVLERGIDGLRLNPGNIGERWKVAEVVKAAAERRVPIRIGVNAGSLEQELLQKYGHPTAEAMVRELRADKLFLMVTGITPEFGLSHTNISEVTIKQSMIHSAREVILLADHTCFGRESTIQVAPLTSAHKVITDDALPASTRLELTKQGLQVIVAGKV